MKDTLSKGLRDILAQYNAFYGASSDGTGKVDYVCLTPEISGDYDTSTEFEFENEEDLVKRIDEFAENFDVDEEIRKWMDEETKHPPIKTMLKDFEDMKEKFKELADKLLDYERDKKRSKEK